MSNEEVVQRFLKSYQEHNFKAMHEGLDDGVRFNGSWRAAGQ